LTRVLERLSPRAISSHLRTFADYLICEFSSSNGNQQINKCIDSLNDLVWKCCIVPIDRLILCLVKKFCYTLIVKLIALLKCLTGPLCLLYFYINLCDVENLLETAEDQRESIICTQCESRKSVPSAEILVPELTQTPLVVLIMPWCS